MTLAKPSGVGGLGPAVFSNQKQEEILLSYQHSPIKKLHDPDGRLAAYLARQYADNHHRLSPGELGRLGGEMARRMVEAALVYLEEQAVERTRASFDKAAFGGARQGGAASHGPGPAHKMSRVHGGKSRG
jgi:hypothetical protein